jgi:hypothetical protein
MITIGSVPELLARASWRERVQPDDAWAGAVFERVPASANPDDLTLATLAALQGGLLRAQVQRDPRPLAVALDAMIDRIQALTEMA